MTIRLFGLALAAGFAFAGNATAQDVSPATYAYANGNDSYLRFTGPKYEKGKKYTVYNIRKADEPLSAEAQAKAERLKQQLLKKGVALVDVPWKTEADLVATMKPQAIEATVTDGSHIKLKGKTFNLSTTSGNALLVMGGEDIAVSICSGAQCEERMKTFFGLTALN